MTRTRLHPEDPALEPFERAQVHEPTLLIENERGRLALYAHAEKRLPKGEALVQVKDLYGRRRSFETRPCSPRAQLVAREVPLVMRGSLTSIVSYYRVPADELDAVESHFENGELSHTYDVRLRVACLGRRPVKMNPHTTA